MAVCAIAQGTTTADYLKLRNARHIVQPIPTQALDELAGTRVVELQGLIQGSFKSGETVSLMLQLPDGETQLVECPTNPPDWLLNGEVAVRILAKVSRVTPQDQLSATLIAAAPEAPLAEIDEAYWRKEAAKKPKKQRAKSLASRDGSELYGWIGTPHLQSRWVTARITEGVLQAYADCIRHQNHRLTNDQARYIAWWVIQLGQNYNVEPRLVMAVLIVESGFDPGSVSSKGAMGLGQLMPGTAQWMGVKDPSNVADNLYGTVKLMATLINEYGAQTGDLRTALPLALAAYNAGEGAVKRHGGIPPYRETQAYVSRVIQVFNRLCGQ